MLAAACISRVISRVCVRMCVRAHTRVFVCAYNILRRCMAAVCSHCALEARRARSRDTRTTQYSTDTRITPAVREEKKKFIARNANYTSERNLRLKFSKNLFVCKKITKFVITKIITRFSIVRRMKYRSEMLCKDARCVCVVGSDIILACICRTFKLGYRPFRSPYNVLGHIYVLKITSRCITGLININLSLTACHYFSKLVLQYKRNSLPLSCLSI